MSCTILCVLQYCLYYLCIICVQLCIILHVYNIKPIHAYESENRYQYI